MVAEIKHFYVFNKKYLKKKGIIFSKRSNSSGYYLANINLTLVSKIRNEFEISMAMILNLQKHKKLVVNKGLEIGITIKNRLHLFSKLDFSGKKSIRLTLTE